ncbi:MAG TPA: SAM-dependent methyltransferase, partial [Mycobacterium sp.]|nr:SAM-dependent methyltransferase [Mycobacterium sp.]
LDYIPLMRLRVGVQGQEINRPGWGLRLSPTHLAFAQLVDGERSIRDIAERVAFSGVLANSDQAEMEAIGLELFEGLWRTDFIAIDLSRAAQR